MVKIVRQLVAPCLAVAAFAVFTALPGCGKKAPPASPGGGAATDRLNDPAYVATLEKAEKRQNEILARQKPLSRNMERMRQRARDVLGKDATEAQVVAELDAHPEKYPGWRELKAQARDADAEMKRENARMREIVRRRILKDMAARKKASMKTK